MFRRLMPDVGAPATRLMTCLYTRTPDGHFLIDRSPDHARIVLASPCTGHGFKFASLFGKCCRTCAVPRVAQDMALFRLAQLA